MTTYQRYLRHDTRSGVMRLSLCMKYLSEGVRLDREARSRPSDPHFSALDAASRTAMDWWVSSIETRKSRGTPHDIAVGAEYMKFAAGPSSHPAFVDSVREIWFETIDINLSEGFGVNLVPARIIIDSVIERGNICTLSVLTAMPYWPIGLDENGNWC